MADQGASRTAVVVEDDDDIRQLLVTVLRQAGFTVHAAADGATAVEAVRRHDPLVTTVDVNLPDIDGYEVVRRIRGFSDTYVVMLTALPDEIDVLMGLDAGADDYQVKPFRARELRARIEALLRRPRARRADAGSAPPPPFEPGVDTGAPDDHRRVEHGPLVVDLDAHAVTVDGTEVHLTRSEFDLLTTLAERTGRVVPKDDLVRALRGEEYDAGVFVSDAERRSLEVHMVNLRRKLGDDGGSPRWIQTVRGVGYKFVAPA
ncbi:response regulator transcription factor [Cellulomonas iranensis]|jgi:DNA-binding response OmpR family regulator|uniref:response regulator transcription factor n=1 Tax=Cellulomonas iranensis TaxID=76862 RepID=UPI0013D04820|nr:response regulator transcription factor [Cellulomonas iranensis]